MTHISVTDISNARGHDDRDIARAEEAAAEVLRLAGVDPIEAEHEFRRQWAYLGSDEAADAGLSQDDESLTGLARVWADAQAAAGRALTATRDKPTASMCHITTWR